CREMGTPLAAVAMLRAGEGRYDEAWRDLLACHRLARHMGRGGSSIERLVAVAIESIACEADLVLLDRTKLDAQQLLAYSKELQQLPALPPMADAVDLFERF